MSYVVLARKWRPQTFDDLTGQQHVAQTLTHAIERERVPHAMLFTGARGVGKTSSARIVAMALNCAQGPTPSPCGVCDACREIQRSQSVDVLEIDGASNRGINEIRELREGVRYAPNRDRYKIYIIDEVHMLTTEAFNALLKTLEEPPAHVVFIFATTEAHKIPVTILSRCQRFDFRRIPHAEIVSRLRHIVDREEIDVGDDVLGLIARQADGGMRDALSLLDQVIAFAGSSVDADAAAEILGAAERRRLFDLTDAIVCRDTDRALGVLAGILAYGVDVAHLAAETVAHLRDLIVVATTSDPRALTALSATEIAQAREQVARTDASTLHRMFEIMAGAAEEISRSAHGEILFEMAMVRMTALEPASSIMALIRRLEALARGADLPPTPDGAPPSSAPPSSTTPSDTPSPAAPSTPPAASPVADAAPAPTAPSEPEPEAQAMPEPAPELQTQPEPEAQAEPEPEVRAEPRTQPEPEPEPEVLAQTEPEPEVLAQTEPEPEVLAQTEPEPEVLAQTEPEPEIQTQREPVAQPEPASAAEPDAEPPPERADGPSQGEGEQVAPEAWRRVVDRLRSDRVDMGGLLAGATLLESRAGQVVVALPRALRPRWNDETQAWFREAAAAELGVEITLELQIAEELDDEVLAAGYEVRREEARERAERRRQIRQYVEEHPAVARIRQRWPGARMADVQITDLPQETSST